MNELLTYKADGALRFVNQKYYEQGNKASRVLAFQPKKSQASRTVHKVACPLSKKLLSHPKEIANAFSKYYKQLYDSPNKADKIKQFFQQMNLTKLNDDEAKASVGTIAKEEIKFQAELIPLSCRVFN